MTTYAYKSQRDEVKPLPARIEFEPTYKFALQYHRDIIGIPPAPGSPVLFGMISKKDRIAYEKKGWFFVHGDFATKAAFRAYCCRLYEQERKAAQS